MKAKTYFKVAMFNLSLLPLYIILCVQHFDAGELIVPRTLLEFKAVVEILIYSNLFIFFIVVVLVLLGFIALYLFKNMLKYGREDTKSFSNIKTKEFEHLTFIATYVLPLFAYEIKDIQSFIVFLLLLVLIGTLYVKSNWYYLNPILLLFGYRIYSAEINGENVVLIARAVISDNEIKSRYIDLGSNIWYLVDKSE